MDLHQKIRTLPTSAGVYLYKNADGQVIYVGKAKNLRARVRSYFRGSRRRKRQDRLAAARGRRSRLHRGRQRARSAGSGKQSHQAEEAALQHSSARRQDLSLHQAHHGRALSASVCHAAAAQRRLALLRAVLSHQPGVSHRRSHSPPLSDSVLQARLDPLSSAAMPAVLHRALPGPVRGRAHHARALRRGRARCETVS